MLPDQCARTVDQGLRVDSTSQVRNERGISSQPDNVLKLCVPVVDEILDLIELLDLAHPEELTRDLVVDERDKREHVVLERGEGFPQCNPVTNYRNLWMSVGISIPQLDQGHHVVAIHRRPARSGNRVVCGCPSLGSNRTF